MTSRKLDHFLSSSVKEGGGRDSKHLGPLSRTSLNRWAFKEVLSLYVLLPSNIVLETEMQAGIITTETSFGFKYYQGSSISVSHI